MPWDATNPDGSLAFQPVACSHHTYAFTSGEFRWVGLEDFSRASFTAVGVSAVDEDGEAYRVVGGESYSDPGGRLNVQMRFVPRSGPVVDSIDVVLRMGAGGGFFMDHGTCAY